MKNLLIIGAGGFGREVLSYALEMQQNHEDWRVKGFLDDNLYALDGFDTMGYSILGTITDCQIQQNDVFICAIAEPPKVKLSICNNLMQKGANFINFIHPTARVAQTAVMGVGNVLAPHSFLAANVIIGNFNVINIFSGCGHDAMLKDGCTISAHCDITGNTLLEEGAYLGSSSVICPHAKVGRYATVGAGSIVLKRVKENTVVFGNPAKVIF